MRSFVVFILLLWAVSDSGANSLQDALVLAGGEYHHNLGFDGAENSEGIKRLLTSESDGKWQFFYFCETGKNKKTCGSWVDEKGNKIKGANNNVKRTEDGATISKMATGDSGAYTRVPENPDDTHAYLERVLVHVQSPPPPPPKTY